MARLSTPVSFPLFAKVQETAAVEYGLHQLRLQRLEEGRQPIYIAPQAKANLNAKDDDLFSLMENVKEFLESRRQVMLILGDSGSGKSTFNRHLEHDLWSHYEKGGPIPLFINLPSIDRPDLDMVDNQLKHYNFREAQIQELKQHREFILICDGYDENQQMANLHRTNNLNQSGQWSTKTVISCRIQYLGPSYLHRFKPQPNDRYSSVSPDLLQEAVIAPFSINQIENYVKQHIQDPTTQVIFGKQRIWSAKEYMGKLGAIPNLMDLIKNPFLLSLSLKAIPGVTKPCQDLSKVRITRLDLYDTFVRQWLDINMRRLQTSNLNSEERTAFNFLIDYDFIMSGIDCLKRISASIFLKQDGNPVVQYLHRRDQGTWKADFFGPKAEVKLLRESGPLARIGYLYRFVHRSALEYFYSRFVFEPELTEEEFDPQAGTGTIDSLSSAADLPLSQMNLVVESSIIQFLAERVHQFSAFKDQLLAVVELSKVDPTASQAASNAITILVQAGVQFNGFDLRGIRVPGAGLSGGQFDSAQLQGADSTRVDFTRSWIPQVDFTGTQMEGTEFGELPYLKSSS
ncbi:Transducin (beta)-like 1 X-linked receptor 1 [Mortierella sp. AD031]|nr:Transducin (beta)-like 1 X-linked receptor 1 [Mortierella sp. AD031]